MINPRLKIKDEIAQRAPLESQGFENSLGVFRTQSSIELKSVTIGQTGNEITDDATSLKLGDFFKSVLEVVREEPMSVFFGQRVENCLDDVPTSKLRNLKPRRHDKRDVVEAF